MGVRSNSIKKERLEKIGGDSKRKSESLKERESARVCARKRVYRSERKSDRASE